MVDMEGVGVEEGLGVEMVPEGTESFSGTPLVAGSEIVELVSVQDAIRQVYDPEIPVNIFDLGLIYDVDVKEDGHVDILMTLTAPACPVAGELPQEVADAVAAVKGVGTVCVTLTWSPPWTMERLSEDARLALDFY
jgi:FeS assembly SUF system protein